LTSAYRTAAFAAAFVSPGSFAAAAIAAASSDPKVAGAGDIACDPANSNYNAGKGNSANCRQLYTSNLIYNQGFAAVLALGDNQYYCGGLSAFQQSFETTWGRFKALIHPAPGNHEYLTTVGADHTGCDSTNAGAAGYFNYFGSAAGTRGQGWYSFDVGSWHIIALNSNCGDAGGCSSTSAQGKWLASDLANHKTACTLAYWHIPVFSSGGRASSNAKPLFTQLYNANADLVLTGHDHLYERFAPQTPGAVADSARGVREFVVGTGGKSLVGWSSIKPNSEVRSNTSFGVLRMTLHSGSYDWKFQPIPGMSFTDSGSTACH
jgi:hypothetical protein